MVDHEANGQPHAVDVYQIVRGEGEAELERPTGSLWWSGVAGGFAISTSVLGEGLLEHNVPASPWRTLVVDFGYSVGFLIAILGRMQLFTENTIRPILPLLLRFTWRNLGNTGRVWGVVYLANLVGTLVVAVATVRLRLLDPGQLDALLEVSRHALDRSAWQALTHGVPAGFLIAALVWLLPSSRGNEFWVILVIVYVIALGDFTHCVAGASEAFFLVANGERGFVGVLGGHLLPALVGNVLGGTLLFSLLAYGQVRREID